MLSLNYKARHERVRCARGPARNYLCEHCGKQAEDWATIHGRDGMYHDEYISLCRPCHAKYDNRSEATKLGIAAKGKDHTLRRHTPEARRRMSEAQFRRWENQEATPAQRAVFVELNKSRRGQSLSEETKRKLSEIGKGRPQAESHRAARQAAQERYWLEHPPATTRDARRRWSKRHGSAKAHLCECGKQACDWVASDQGFFPLCRPCNMARR